MTKPVDMDLTDLAGYAGEQANARRLAEARIAAAIALCHVWECAADEYLTSEERDQVGDPRDFSTVRILIARIRGALTMPENIVAGEPVGDYCGGTA
jgi:hypothetical protein